MTVSNTDPKPKRSATVLKPSHRYRLVGSGTVSDWCDGGTTPCDPPLVLNDGVDALYCYATWRCPKPELWRQLQVNGAGLDELAGKAGKLPYSSGHVYTVEVTGISGALTVVASDATWSAGGNSGQFTLTITDLGALVRAPAAADLLARLKGCRAISSARFANDAGGRRSVPICGGVAGVVSWKADMDVDCDGRVTPNCNKKVDPSFQPGTALEPGGRPLSAETTRYVVVPRPSKQFDYRKLGIKLGSVVAVVYNGKVTFAVLGDVGPRGIIGEASYATAKDLGIDPNPRSGGVDSGVTYIVFKGTKVADPTSNGSIDEAGLAAAAKLLGGG